MNTKISLPELIDQLSRKSNCTKKEAEQFLKEFFSLAADTVVQGENLKINGLGQFRLVWVETACQCQCTYRRTDGNSRALQVVVRS